MSLSSVALAQSTNLDQGRALDRDLMADAAGRTNSLAQGDREFTVNLHGYTQFRYNINQRDDEALDEDLTIGFQNARTAINLSGNIANENWGYFIQFLFSDAQGGGSAELQDAYATYRAGNGWRWTFGQFKLPLFREEYVGDQYLLFADRSVNNSVFNQSRSQGIMVDFETDNIQFFGAFSDGLGTANTDFNSGAEADWAATARLNYKFAGAWKQARDFTSFQNSDYFGMVGVAGHYQDGGETFATTDARRIDATIDASIEGNGWNVFAAGMWNNMEPEVGDDTDTFGFIIQGGVFVAPQWEIIGSFDMVLPDDDETDADEFSTIRVGFNYYMVPDSHALKATVDFSYFLDNPSESIVPASTLTGLLNSDEDGQWNLRAQLQWLF
jgi:hypothetical protein